MDTEVELVSKCLNHELAAQTELYNLFASKMYGICLRYAGNKMEAEDILQNGFLRVFNSLHQFHFNGSLEGWVKRTIINAAINFCKHNNRYFQETDLNEGLAEATFSEDALSILTTKELLAMVQELPPGRRTVFNLNIIEGYDHKEIGVMLGISEVTSRTQLHRAKASIRKRLQKLEKV